MPSLIPSREAKLPLSAQDKRVLEAFKKRTTPKPVIAPWDCKRGMHEPEWDETFCDWGCKGCGKALSQ